MTKKHVVVIGGGTGTYQVLVGLKQYPQLELSAVVAMSDSGGSSGRLRSEFGMLPPGDIRRALLALSSLPIREKTLERLFDFRFKNGKELRGHSLGNIFLAALTQITGSPEKAIAEAERILAVSGRVLPVTLDNTHLCAVLADGSRIFGETRIDIREEKPKVPIKKVYLRPKARVFPQARDAILKADLIVLGPGDLYTSIIPNLLVSGVTDAIAKSRGKIIFVVNLMTKHGETDNFTTSEFVEEIKCYLDSAARKLACVIVNNSLPKGKILSWYKRFKAQPVKDNLNGTLSFQTLRGNFVANGINSTHLIRHSPQKLAKALIKLI